MNLIDLAFLLDSIENDTEALRELAAHWELAGHWNDNATWTADMLMQHARDVADAHNLCPELTLPESWSLEP